jgi:hypothetical protein
MKRALEYRESRMGGVEGISEATTMMFLRTSNIEEDSHGIEKDRHQKKRELVFET